MKERCKNSRLPHLLVIVVHGETLWSPAPQPMDDDDKTCPPAPKYTNRQLFNNRYSYSLLTNIKYTFAVNQVIIIIYIE